VDGRLGSKDARGFFVRRGASVLRAIALVGLVAGAAVVLVSLFGGDGFGLIEAGSGEGAYLPVFGLVAADAVIPIFSGETTLNAASTLAADGELDSSQPHSNPSPAWAGTLGTPPLGRLRGALAIERRAAGGLESGAEAMPANHRLARSALTGSHPRNRS